MTRRSAGVLLAAVILVALGASLRWPELTGLGAAALALVFGVLLTHGMRPRAAFLSTRPLLRATRFQPLTVDLSLAVRRTRSLRLTVGDVRDPALTVGVPPGQGGVSTMRVPVDTSCRGELSLGPFTVVHGDPWGFVRRTVAVLRGGKVTVHPRVHPLTRGPLAESAAAGSDTLSRRQGTDHFHALRDYVLGDEPRKVHWRSSARAGRLVVRQEVAAASSGTAIVLDVDITAFGSDEAFSTSDDPERFEFAVEVAASVAVAQARVTPRVHLFTTARGSRPTSTHTGASSSLLDTLAAVRATAPVATAPEETLAVLRRLRCSRVVVVSGTASGSVQRMASAVGSTGARVLLVRVGARGPLPVAGVRVVDVRSSDDLS